MPCEGFNWQLIEGNHNNPDTAAPVEFSFDIHV
uniref:Uncharacterized protein n=1 Tax=Anguilla anguilla TaxID=7936 RepID=A0A0E9VHU0_ANGAN